jgi:hypothetical protein
MLGCVQVKEKFARELKRVIVSQQTRQEYRLKHQTFSCDMQVSIEPPSSIQNSNDIAYTWHGSTDLYQILGENQSHICQKVSFNSEGLQFGTIANLICGQSGR